MRQVKDTVIALHPDYSFSYAPAIVLEVESADVLRLRFYDGKETSLVRYVVPKSDTSHTSPSAVDVHS